MPASWMAARETSAAASRAVSFMAPNFVCVAPTTHTLRMPGVPSPPPYLTPPPPPRPGPPRARGEGPPADRRDELLRGEAPLRGAGPSCGRPRRLPGPPRGEARRPRRPPPPELPAVPHRVLRLPARGGHRGPDESPLHEAGDRAAVQ